MEATIQGDGQSSLSVTKTGITIRLPSQVFGKGWVNVMTWLQEAIASSKRPRSARAMLRLLCASGAFGLSRTACCK